MTHVGTDPSLNVQFAPRWIAVVGRKDGRRFAGAPPEGAGSTAGTFIRSVRLRCASAEGRFLRRWRVRLRFSGEPCKSRLSRAQPVP